ncbi:hypothetical protein V5799_024711 [Amblyomma americanum]|uniref:Uncharacterized protein n=1 Tax=Amblyomma americanum TaxID=6943 RepID=A0AAQ4EBD7_AMBAM
MLDKVPLSVCNRRYICGAWVRRSWRPVYDDVWRKFLERIYDAVKSVQVPAAKQSPQEKAAAYVEACLGTLEASNLEGVRRVLAQGGITWPEEVPATRGRPDLLNGLLYMARKVFTPVFLDVSVGVLHGRRQRSVQIGRVVAEIGGASGHHRHNNIIREETHRMPTHYQSTSGITVDAASVDMVDEQNRQGLRTLAFTLDGHFESVQSQLRYQIASSYARQHFEATYEAFGGTFNQTRTSELFDDYFFMQKWLAGYHNAEGGRGTMMNASSLPSLTPSITETSWDTMLKRYFNASLVDLEGGLYIEDRRRFSALFDLHREFGEARSLALFGFLCIQALLPFTSRQLLESFQMADAESAVEYQRVYCLSTAYAGFRDVIYGLLRDETALLVVRRLADAIEAAFMEENREDFLQFSEPISGLNTSTGSVFRFFSGTKPETMKHVYPLCPDMTNDPLRNKIALYTHLEQTLPDVASSSPATSDGYNSFGYSREDVAAYSGFQLTPQHFYFPWLTPDVHLAALYGGLGTRLASVLFFGRVNARDDASSVYAQNDRCLLPVRSASQAVHTELQAAVVSLRIAWRAYAKASANLGVKDLLPLRTDVVLFAFNCWLLCGSNEGETLCNVPLRQSADFARVLNCSTKSSMNLPKRCSLLI